MTCDHDVTWHLNRFCNFRWCTASGHFGETTDDGRSHAFYREKLMLTKIKILMAQKRVSWPLQLFSDLLKCLKFDDRYYKMAKLPNSHKLCPLFMAQPANNERKDSDSLVVDDGVARSEYAQHCLMKLRLEFMMTLTTFYLRPNVGAHKFAFHSMEFALQYFGGNPVMKVWCPKV